ncbi:MAG: YfiR family protein [Burkholderiaceae bacterium]|jgi:hypothetical protein
MHPSDLDVKAAFLYRFLDYVDWQSSSMQPDEIIVIAVMSGDDMLEAVRRTLQGKRSGSHPLEVRKITPETNLAGVRVVYIGSSVSNSIGAVAKRASATSTLVVTDTENALAQGSDINFVETGGRVRFEVDLENAERAGLKLGSGMLSVAVRVRGAP